MPPKRQTWKTCCSFAAFDTAFGAIGGAWLFNSCSFRHSVSVINSGLNRSAYYSSGAFLVCRGGA